MKIKIEIVFFIITLAYATNAFNILGIFPYQGKSHFYVYRIILQELAKQGHSVTVISHFPEDKPPSNYTDISLAGTIKIFEDDIPAERSYRSMFNLIMYLVKSGIDTCDVLLGNKEVQNIVNTKPKFDIVIMELFNSDCGFAIAHKLGVPVVGITSCVLMPWHYTRMGIPQNPAFVSFHFLEGGTKPTLFQKIERIIVNSFSNAVYYYITQKANDKTVQKYFDGVPPLEELAREVKFHMVYHNFVLTGSRLFPANFIEVGGFHVPQAQNLTGELKTFIDEAEHGIIFISFGSVVKSSTLPDVKIQAILGAMMELPQRFVWKWDGHQVLLDKDKLYVSYWLPQIDLLGHPKTLAFFSHAGMGSTTESIHYGVPMVVMPIMGDQPSNAASVEESGLGIQIALQDLTKENLLRTFKQVTEPSFRQNVKEMSKAWHDRPTSPLETAVFWTEYAARHPNIRLRTAAADVFFYEYYLLDVFSVFITVFALSIIILRFLCCRTKNERVLKKKTKQH